MLRMKKIVTVLLAAVMGMAVLSGCAPRESSTILTVGDEKISYGEANFTLRYTQSMYEAYYASYGSDMKTTWAGKSSDGKTSLEDSVKNSVRDQLENNVLLRQHMDEYGVVLTDSDKEAIKTAAEAFISANSKETLDTMNATQENVEEYLQLATIQSRMHDKMIADVDTNVTDEEALQKGISYVTFSYQTQVENQQNTNDQQVQDVIDSLSGVSEDAAKSDAQAFRDAVVSEEDFGAYAESQGLTASTGSAGKDGVTPSKDAAKAAFALSQGQTTEVIQDADNSCFYVVRVTSDKDDAATEQQKSTIVSQRQQDAYDSKLEEMRKGTTIKWNKRLWKKASLTDVGVSMKIPDDVQQAAQEAANSDAASGTLAMDSTLTVADGDKVNIDYVGTIDGQEFDGGNTNGQGTDLTIGSGTYIPGFEDQLIGAHPGDTVTVNVTFPEDYGKEELNGKEAQFTVTVNGIYQ